MAVHMVSRRRMQAWFGGGLLIAALFASVAVANAAIQQVGTPVTGTKDRQSFGHLISMSADGSRIATSSDVTHENKEVFVYELRDGSWEPLGQPIVGGVWTQGALAMSADGSHIVVGDPRAGTGPEGSGHGEVRVYGFDGDDWRIQGSPLEGTPGAEVLGDAVAISADGSRIVLAASVTGPGGEAVRVFDLVNENWAPTGAFAGTGSLGTSLAMSADGTRFVSGDTSGSGQLIIFELADGTWEQVGIAGSGSVSNEQLGRVVSMSADGSRVATRGLRSPDDNSASHVSVFGEVDGEWELVGNRLTGQTRTGTRRNGFNDNFGLSISLSGDGNRLAVGAPGTGVNGELSGSVTVFEIEATAWEPIATFIGPHTKASMGIGVSLNGDGSRVLTGTPNFDTFKNNPGQLNVFDLGVTGPVCGGQPATLVGTAGIDRLIGTPGPDVIVGLQGNDIIKGLGGDDVICSGRGDDIVFGGQGFDIIFGAQGDDRIFASNSSTELGRRDSRGARVFGGAGNDTIFGSNRWDRIRGGLGNDTVFGYEGRDWIRGGQGADRLDGGSSIDDLHGGNGNDTFIVMGNDRVRGGAGVMDRCEITAESMPTLISCELR